MDAFSDPAVQTVVVMSSAQVGKTEILNNVVGYFVNGDPSPMLILTPTLSLAQAWSKDRLAPMIRDTPALRGKVKEARTRDSENTILHKKFAGGHITIVGANAATDLAGRPVRIVLADEVDRFPVSAGTEGDPYDLARKRATAFWNKRFGMFSTPTIANESRIEAAFNESDKRYYFVPCPACGSFQRLRWAQVVWEKDAEGKHLPDTARYECDSCGEKWDDTMRWRAVRHGEWRATAPFNRIAGFHVWEAYSSWVRLSETVTNFLAAKGDPVRMQVFANTSLGECFDLDAGDEIDESSLFGRREDWRGTVPTPTVLLVGAVDVQDDRIEVSTIGVSASGAWYVIEVRQVWGDPSTPTPWNDLDTLLDQPYKRADGVHLTIACAGVDSGGHHTLAVYQYCKARAARRIWAFKGVGGQGRPLVGRPSKSNKGGVQLFPIGVDTAKERIFARLKMAEPGPGYIHFSAALDVEFFEQLSSERCVKRVRKGRPVREYVQIRPRNEALDLAVYTLAAIEILNPDLARIEKKLAAAAERIAAETPTPKADPDEDEAQSPRRLRGNPRKRGGGWVNAWNR